MRIRRLAWVYGRLVIAALSGWLATSSRPAMVLAQGQQRPTGSDVLPRPEPPFQGKVGRTVKESTPDFPVGVQAPKGFSLDETFDVGEDTGTPVVEDYADKMPFRFTGKLSKFTIDLTESNQGRSARR